MDRHFISNIDDVFLAKYFAGELSKDQEKEVLAWVAMDVSNRDLFEKSEAVWKKTGSAIHDKQVPHRDVEAAWSKLKSRIDKVPQLSLVKDEITHNIDDNKTRTPFWLKVAAGLALLIGVYSTTNWLLNKSGDNQYYAEAIKEVVLPDSSVVTLNKGASIEIENGFVGKERRLKLRGEAFFQVKKNESKPFVIKVAKAEVIVLGTSFFVKNLKGSEHVDVSVESGKVRLRKEKSKEGIDLVAGEKGVFNNITQEVKKEVMADPAASFWKNKTLVFKKTTLIKVLEVLKNVYSQEIILRNNELNKC